MHERFVNSGILRHELLNTDLMVKARVVEHDRRVMFVLACNLRLH